MLIRVLREYLRPYYGPLALVLLLQLVAMAKTPVMMMSFLVDSAQHAIAGSASYFEVMDAEPEPHAAVSAIVPLALW